MTLVTKQQGAFIRRMFLKKCICVLSIFIGLTFKQNIAEFSGFRPSSSTLRAEVFLLHGF